MTTTDHWRLAAPPEACDDDPPVTALMTHRIVGITADVSLSTALCLMAEGGIRHLPVFEGTRCRGLLLDADVVGHLLAGAPAERSTESIADLIRAVPVVTTAARRSRVARSMRDGGLDAALVIERDRLVGIVTATDLVRSLAGPPDALTSCRDRADREPASPAAGRGGTRGRAESNSPSDTGRSALPDLPEVGAPSGSDTAGGDD